MLTDEHVASRLFGLQCKTAVQTLDGVTLYFLESFCNCLVAGMVAMMGFSTINDEMLFLLCSRGGYLNKDKGLF